MIQYIMRDNLVFNTAYPSSCVTVFSEVLLLKLMASVSVRDPVLCHILTSTCPKILYFTALYSLLASIIKADHIALPI